MGKYDNYSNDKNIKVAQKKLDKLTKARKQDLFAIELAEAELEKAKLFESCQIFGSEVFFRNGFDPNSHIMFSDDNRVLMFVDKLLRYDDIASYRFVERVIPKSSSQTKQKGTLSRAIVGGAIAGGVGAVVGAMSAGSVTNTTSYSVPDGFYLQIFMKDGQGWQYSIPNTGVFGNKMSRKWSELGAKIQMIIDEKV